MCLGPHHITVCNYNFVTYYPSTRSMVVVDKGDVHFDLQPTTADHVQLMALWSTAHASLHKLLRKKILFNNLFTLLISLYARERPIEDRNVERMKNHRARDYNDRSSKSTTYRCLWTVTIPVILRRKRNRNWTVTNETLHNYSQINCSHRILGRWSIFFKGGSYPLRFL